jgi:lactaldehyde dehydrogenase/glycolaldehyde dehydrogenase
MKNYQLFINGEFVDSNSDKDIKVINPANEEVISIIPDATIEEVKTAIDSAYNAQTKWAKLSSIERAKYLRRIADGIRKNANMLTEILMEEQGKIRSLANT